MILGQCHAPAVNSQMLVISECKGRIASPWIRHQLRKKVFVFSLSNGKNEITANKPAEHQAKFGKTVRRAAQLKKFITHPAQDGECFRRWRREDGKGKDKAHKELWYYVYIPSLHNECNHQTCNITKLKIKKSPAKTGDFTIMKQSCWITIEEGRER